MIFEIEEVQSLQGNKFLNVTDKKGTKGAKYKIRFYVLPHVYVHMCMDNETLGNRKMSYKGLLHKCTGFTNDFKAEVLHIVTSHMSPSPLC